MFGTTLVFFGGGGGGGGVWGGGAVGRISFFFFPLFSPSIWVEKKYVLQQFQTVSHNFYIASHY